MLVMKFGGTSTAGKESIERLVSIVQGRLEKKPVIVVSAMAKVTDALYKLADTAASGDAASTTEQVEALRDRHIEVAEQLLGEHPGYLLPATSRINEICDELETFTAAVCAIGELSDRSRAVIISNGELLSSTLIEYALDAAGIPTGWVDARRMIITNGEYLCGEPVISEIEARVPGIIEEAFKGNQAVITQGFISSTVDGIPTVIGRGGSDYSASLIGMAIEGTEAIEIWTDVNGVQTADPRMVSTARKLDRLSFEEASEMAHFGAKVLHPLTIEPAVRKNIPIYVLNSFDASNSGTVILQGNQIEPGVKSVSFKENILVVNIYSTKMINATGFLGKVFDVFGKYNVSVDLISTSEANISVTCDGNVKNLDKVVSELSEFATVEVDRDKSQISVIGRNLFAQPGAMEKIFEPLHGTPLYMISQGASFINVSLVLDRSALKESVCKIHDTLFGC